MLIDEFGNIADMESDKNIIFFGASTRNQHAIDELGIKDRVLFFVDSDEKKAGVYLGDYLIKPISSLQGRTDCVVVSVLIEVVKFEQVLKTVQQYNMKCLFYTDKYFDIEKSITVNYSASGRCLNKDGDITKREIKNNSEIVEKASGYKYVHIFPSEKFIKPFYRMLEERMEISKHLFIVDYYDDGIIYNVLEDVGIQNEKHHNILIFNDLNVSNQTDKCNAIYEDAKLINILSAAEKIILHSVAMENKMKKVLKKWSDTFGGKMSWICMGADSSYANDTDVIEILSNVRYTYAASGRHDKIRESYGIEAGILNCALYGYIPHADTSAINEKIPDCKYILLGYSATGYGRQDFGLDLLAKWKNENIRIYCPLSYGSGSISRRDDIIAKGKSIFKDKFIPLLDFMEMDKYYEFLNDIDVAVIPITAMAGGTTMQYLTSKNKKIYLSAKFIDEFKKCGIFAEDIENIRTESFEEFIKNENKNDFDNDGNEAVIKEWIRIFEDK